MTTRFNVLKIEDIIVEQRLKKINEDFLELLTGSIKKLGLINPIIVTEHDGKYVLVAGNSRLIAHKKLNKIYINSLIVEDYYEVKAIIEAEENLITKDLDKYEKVYLQYKQNKELENLGFDLLRDKKVEKNKQNDDFMFIKETEIADILTFKEAAEIYNLDSSTLRKLVNSNKLVLGEDYRKSGGTWLITRNAMERLYNKRNKD